MQGAGRPRGGHIGGRPLPARPRRGVAMSYSVLTDAQKLAFRCDGYLVVKAALSHAEVRDLEFVADGLMKRHSPQGQGSGLEKHETQVQLRRPIAETPELLPLVGNGSTVSLCAQLLSPNIHLHTAAVLFKFPHACAPEERQAQFELLSAGWHRDIGITEDMGHEHVFRAGIKVCYALTDFQSPMSGLTRFARGSHLLRTPLPVDRGGRPTTHVAVQPPLCRGDAVLFENRIFHCGSVNMQPRVAKSLILGYAYRWMGGHKANMDLVWPRDQALLAGLPPRTQQLLGAEGDGLVAWCRDHGFVRGERGDAFAWVTKTSAQADGRAAAVVAAAAVAAAKL